jgi:peptidoglycan/xylan/chitin deacetylase (PgdA/CDA1 family)
VVELIDSLKGDPGLWDLFTSREEYRPTLLDQHQRFPFYLSQNRNVFSPQISLFLVRNGLKIEYPGDSKFAVCITHDIDVVTYSGLKMVYECGRAFLDGKTRRSLNILLNRLSKRLNPIWNFTEILELERKYGAKSTFFFPALEKNERDFNFRIDNLKDEIKTIIESGGEIGLHGGYDAYNDLDVIKKQKERIERAAEKEIIGYRNHYLRFAVPQTWRLLEAAGIKYDTTFGYADCVGFRNGMCHPFRPYDRDSQTFLKLLEIPLIVMDCTFDLYMRLSQAEAWILARRLIDAIENLGGVFAILWHNTYMLDEKLELFEKILSCCHAKKAWMTTGEEIFHWWENNHFTGFGARR